MRASLIFTLLSIAATNAGSAASFEAVIEPWNATLARHVRGTEARGIPYSGVDYSALARGDADYLRALQALERADLKGLDKGELLSFWINAYNLLAVKMVADHWPIDSIRDAGGTIVGRVWKKDAGKVAGKMRSLDEIEHEILRAMNEPRIHVAIVCASLSCPDLRAEAYRSERLEEQLDEQMRGFLANREKGARLDRSRSTLYLSPIFDWFAEDFELGGEGVLDYLLPYLPEEYRPWITSHRDTLSIGFLDYDWGVNLSSP